MLFFRQLQLVTNRINETENIDQIMLEVSSDICKLFNAERLTLYAVSDDRTSIVSKVKTGLNSTQDLRVPMGTQSIAGYGAMSKQMINIVDVYDINTLTKVHPSLSFLQAVDKRSGYRTKQMLVAPVMNGDALYGVLQVINNRGNLPFSKLEQDGAQQLCDTLGIAIRQRMQNLADSNTHSNINTQRKKVTKFDGLVADGVLSQQELTDGIQKAREQGETVEHLLMSDHQIRPAQIGPSLGKFFWRYLRAFQCWPYPLGNAAWLAQA